MCGIVGFTGSPNEAALRDMTQTLFHRGPDDEGYYSVNQVSLGFRRLAILDLEHGAQPIKSPDGKLVSVFNGEIYNHQALRRKLEKLGFRFSSEHSDAELIPVLYRVYGKQFPSHLDGMFAIAIYDLVEDELVLVRDQAGIKPLFYSQHANGLVFGSEIKALFCHPAVVKTANTEALYHYFSFKNCPAPETAFAGIKQLRAGELLTFKNGQVSCKYWWELSSQVAVSGIDEAAHLVRDTLEKSVATQASADVEVGAFLSGGVDSSSIVALMSQHSSQAVKTFTMVYEEDFMRKAQDRDNARLLSKLYATEHYELTMTESLFWEGLDDVVRSFDEPFSGVTSTYFLSSLISRHVKVALSGDGADELFGSYMPHRLTQTLAIYENLSEEDRLAWRHHEFNHSYLDSYKGMQAHEQRASMSLWPDNEKQSLFTDSFKHQCRMYSSSDKLARFYQESNDFDPLNQVLSVDVQTLLPDQVLAFVDRLSMAHSLEVRPPFLSPEMIALAFSIPGKFKIQGHEVKKVLKQAVRGLVPDQIIDSPKEGFVMPVNDWIQRDQYGKVDEFLDPEFIRKQGILVPDTVYSIRKKSSDGCRRSQMRLWNLMMFNAWWQQHFV